jgi:hypothetical protein
MMATFQIVNAMNNELTAPVHYNITIQPNDSKMADVVIDIGDSYRITFTAAEIAEMVKP